MMNSRPSVTEMELECECDDDESPLDSLLSRKRIVPHTNMLATETYAHDYTEWVGHVWQMVRRNKYNEQVGYTALRTFGVMLSTKQFFTPWPLMKWERYACIWIALKIEDNDTNVVYSAKDFIRSVLGKGSVFKSERKALLKAEKAVIKANQFSMSFPHASDFADVLLHMVGCVEDVRISTFALLKNVSFKMGSVSKDPVVIAVACIHTFDARHMSTFEQLTGCSVDKTEIHSILWE